MATNTTTRFSDSSDEQNADDLHLWCHQQQVHNIPAIPNGSLCYGRWTRIQGVLRDDLERGASMAGERGTPEFH